MPLFSALFNYRYSPEDAAEMEWPGIEMITPLSAPTIRSPWLLMIPAPASSSVHSPHPLAGADRVCRYLQRALKATVDLLDDEPTAPVRKIQVLPRAERHIILEEWNRTDAKFPQGTLDGLFAAQVRRTPSAIAVIALNGVQLPTLNSIPNPPCSLGS